MQPELHLEFARLLGQAVHAIKKCENKKIGLIQDELGYALGRTGGSAVERWRKGYLPPDIPTLEKLARLIKERSCDNLPDTWFHAFFQAAHHPAPEQAYEELLHGHRLKEPVTFTIPAPPQPRPLPQTTGFVGRHTELAYFSEQLAQTGFAAITGMAGIGKTTLATQLARQTSEPDKIFWYPFVAGEGVGLFVRALAAFFAHHNESSLWETLEQARLAGSRPPETGLQFTYLTELLRKQSFLICLDDFQFLDDDPHLNNFLKQMVNEKDVHRSRFLLTSRRLPSFVPQASLTALTGLSLTDTQQLLDQRQVTLAEHLVNALHEKTDGNAQFIMLAIDALQKTREPDQLIERLAESADVERFLMEQVNARLTAQEQVVMETVSLLLGYAGTRDAIEFVANQVRLQPTLTDLTQRHLLFLSPGVYGRAYTQHAIIRNFYYEQLNRRQKRQLHDRAADYYEREEPDRLLAGLHHQKAGNWMQAAELLTTDIWTLVNQGQARPLLRLLESFNEERSQSLPWPAISLAQGDLWAFTGQRDRAEAAYRSVVDLLAQDDLGSRYIAQACRGLSELREYDDPADALTWVSRGLQALDQQDDDATRAALLISQGNAQMNLENLEAAEAALKEGLSIQKEVDPLRSIALRNLGAVCFYRGEREQAIAYTQEALTLSRQQRDPFQTSSILSNLAIFEFESGAWQPAVAHWQEAYETARRLGNQLVAVSAGGNLGGAYINMGNYELAEKYLREALAGAQAGEMKLLVIILKYRLGDLFTQAGAYDKALAWLQEAETLALQAESAWDLPDIYRVQAEARLGLGAVQGAATLANQALELARQADDPVLLGKGWRVLGSVQHELDNTEEAAQAFAISENLLQERDLFETARTQQVWGNFLISSGEQQKGQELLQKARKTYLKLTVRGNI